ncbi:MAG: exosortase family protein XrtG [Clostridiales bacterium]|nr:exosortase family protein XrtG [Clostridiales bacterium]
MKYLIYLIIIGVWIYVLHVLTKSKLLFWRFLLGAFGLFILLMVGVRPILTKPLSQVVAVIAGGFGSLTGTFTAFFKYGILFVRSASESITMQVDFECSGIIEIIAFLSLLAFFEVYNINEKIIVGILGILSIVFANAIRIIVICELIYIGGTDMYYIAHTIIGRLLFYGMSIVLYFYVFTRPQIIRTKVGRFTYGRN